MDEHDTRRYGMFGRVQIFGQDNQDDFAPGSVAARFIAHELPADFVRNLEDGRKAIDAARTAAQSGGNESVASTAAIGRLIADGMKEVTTLDAIMHNKYTRNPDTLRAWKSASHIERAAQREKKPEPTPPTPPSSPAHP